MTEPDVPRIFTDRQQVLAAIGILLASVSFGIVPFFSRGLTEAGLAPHAVAFYRYVIPALVLLPTLVAQRRKWRELSWGMVTGAVMGLGWIGYVRALEVIPASTVGVIYMTYPVFTVLLAAILFAERPTTKALVASAMILLAAIIAGNPASVPGNQLPLLLMALAAPLGFGFGITVLVHRLSRLPPLARIASVSVGSVLALAPLVAASAPADILPGTPQVWLLVIGLSLLTALVPQLIFVISSPVIGAPRTAVIGSVELPTMFLVGLCAFGEHLKPAQLTACGLIIAAILMTQSRAARNVTTQMAKRK